jgi:hypothetical protein
MGDRRLEAVRHDVPAIIVTPTALHRPGCPGSAQFRHVAFAVAPA